MPLPETTMRTLLSAALLLCLLPLPLQAHDGSLPLGDGKLSTSPRQGYLFSCMQRFDPDAGGADADVPWIRGDRWYPAEKAVVEGSVHWPGARITVTREGDHRVVRTNDLPDHPTGIFPVQPDSAAWRWDRNPNRIRAQDIMLTLPADPQPATTPGCVGGEAGFMLTGALLFSAIDAGGRDAVAHEAQDRCNGHPQRAGQYHYHGPSACMKDDAGAAGKHSDLVGYALDGFGIFGIYGENGRELHSADLDECHGHTHVILWDGKPRLMYHYHLTSDFPYSVGCLRGTPAVRGPLGDNRGEHMGPPGREGGGDMRRGRRPPPFGMGPPPRDGGDGFGPPPDGYGPPPPP
jgi:hypothetical protein